MDCPNYVGPRENIVAADDTNGVDDYAARQRIHNERRKKRVELAQQQQTELFEAFEKLNATIAQFRSENEAWKTKVIEDSTNRIVQLESQSKRVEEHVKSNSKRTFAKGDIVWYFRSSGSAYPLDQEEMLLVNVIGVHHDDYPNVYYTIQPVSPLQFINGRNKTSLSMNLFEEKQTDSAHLLHLDER